MSLQCQLLSLHLILTAQLSEVGAGATVIPKSHFTEEETAAEIGKVPCPRSLSWYMVEPWHGDLN